MPGCNRGLEYLYICGLLPPEGRRCWWAEQEETGSGERWRGKRESLRRVRALMAPLTTSSVMVSLSLSECCEIAGRRSTAEDSEETNGLLIQSAER